MTKLIDLIEKKQALVDTLNRCLCPLGITTKQEKEGYESRLKAENEIRQSYLREYDELSNEIGRAKAQVYIDVDGLHINLLTADEYLASTIKNPSFADSSFMLYPGHPYVQHMRLDNDFFLDADDKADIASGEYVLVDPYHLYGRSIKKERELKDFLARIQAAYTKALCETDV